MTEDDGKPMAECDGGCKTWVHIKCHKLKLGEDFYCDKCTEGVQTSKSHMQQDDPVSEPMADSDAEDDDHVEIGGGESGGATLEEEAVPALVSRKSKAVSRSPTPDAAAGAAGNSPDTGAEKTSGDREEPEGAAAKSPEGIPSSKKNKKVHVLKTAAVLAARLAYAAAAAAHHKSSPGSTHCLTLCAFNTHCMALWIKSLQSWEASCSRNCLNECMKVLV